MSIFLTLVVMVIYVVSILVAYGLGRGGRRGYTALERGVGTDTGIAPCLVIYAGSKDKAGYVLNQQADGTILSATIIEKGQAVIRGSGWGRQGPTDGA